MSKTDKNIMDAISKNIADIKEEIKNAREPIEYVNVGIFDSPGLKLISDCIPDNLYEDMKKWAVDNKCGDCYNKELWYFFDDMCREKFVTEFADEINAQTLANKG